MIKTLKCLKIENVHYLIDEGVINKIPSTYIYSDNVIGKYFNEDAKFIYIQYPDGLTTSRRKESCHQIIASEFPHKLEGLYQFKLPDEIEELATEQTIKEIGEYNLEHSTGQLCVSMFKAGYKVATKIYSEEDVHDAIENCLQFMYKNRDNAIALLKTQKEVATEFLQSLNKPKEIESVELKMAGESGPLSIFPLVNDEGHLIISKINYKP